MIRHGIGYMKKENVDVFAGTLLKVSVDGTDYKWMTFKEVECDENIMEKIPSGTVL